MGIFNIISKKFFFLFLKSLSLIIKEIKYLKHSYIQISYLYYMFEFELERVNKVYLYNTHTYFFLIIIKFSMMISNLKLFK